MPGMTEQLVDQPTAAPTRKLTFAAVAEILTLLVGVGAFVGFDVRVSPADITEAMGGFALVVAFVGKFVAYFTRDRAR